MTARNDIKTRRRRRLRQERWQADSRRPVSVRSLRRIKKRVTALFGGAAYRPPGDFLEGIAGRYEPGMFLGGARAVPLIEAQRFARMMSFGKWRPVVTPWRIP